MDISFSNDRAVQYVDMLERLIDEHHDLYIALYDIGVAKPKLHLLYHSPDQIKKWRTGFTTFKPERLHKLLRELGAHGKGATYTEALTKRVALEMLNANEHEMLEVYLVDPKEAPELKSTLSGICTDVGHSIHTANSIQSAIGHITRGEMIKLQCGKLGKVECFVSCNTLTGTMNFFVCYVMLGDVSALGEYVTGDFAISTVSDVLCTMPFFLSQNKKIRLLLPVHL